MAFDGDGRRVKRVDNNGTIHYAGSHYERNVGTGMAPGNTVRKFYYAQMGEIKRLIAMRTPIEGTPTLQDDVASTLSDGLPPSAGLPSTNPWP